MVLYGNCDHEQANTVNHVWWLGVVEGGLAMLPCGVH